MPVPAVVDASLVAVSASRPEWALLLAFLATVGSLAGSAVLFSLARRGGERYLDRHTQGGRAALFRAWFLKYGLLTIFIPGLVPIIPLPLKIFVLSAGALGVPLSRFLLVLLAARVPRYVALAYFGAQLGVGSWDYLKTHMPHLLGAAIVLFVVLYALVRYVDRRRTSAA